VFPGQFLDHMAAVHSCGYAAGLLVQKASQCAHDQKGRDRLQEEGQRVSAGLLKIKE